MTKEELEIIKGLTENAMEFAQMKGELEAVKSERDFLRAILENFGVVNRVSTQVADVLIPEVVK